MVLVTETIETQLSEVSSDTDYDSEEIENDTFS
jgi:hypothetical protein